MEIEVSELTPANLAIVREEWTDLYRHSGCNSPFLMWEWQCAWWQAYGRADRRKPHFLVAKNKSGRWLGLAPLYVGYAHYGGRVQSRVLTVCGTYWRDEPAMVSEYMGFIIRQGTGSTQVRTSLEEYIFESLEWDEFVVRYLDSDDPEFQTFTRFARSRQLPCFVLERMTAYHMNLSRGYQNFLGRISTSGRRSLIGKRKKLDEIACIDLYEFRNADPLNYIDTIDDFHIKRFGSRVFSPVGRKFLSALCGTTSEQIALVVSELRADGRAISLVIDLLVGRRRFNIQSGFDPEFNPSLSIGLIHLAFIAEKCAEDGIEVYDLLAGGGRQNSKFKKSITDCHSELCTLRIFRRGRVWYLYKLVQFVKRVAGLSRGIAQWKANG